MTCAAARGFSVGTVRPSDCATAPQSCHSPAAIPESSRAARCRRGGAPASCQGSSTGGLAVAIFHCNISVASRADGASAVAGAAYISRSAIEFEREGTMFDFTKAHRHERLVADLGIALPDNAPKRCAVERGRARREEGRRAALPPNRVGAARRAAGRRENQAREETRGAARSRRPRGRCVHPLQRRRNELARARA